MICLLVMVHVKISVHKPNGPQQILDTAADVLILLQKLTSMQIVSSGCIGCQQSATIVLQMDSDQHGLTSPSETCDECTGTESVCYLRGDSVFDYFYLAR